MEERIVRLLKERGPQTGSELREALGDDGFAQWKACMRSELIDVRRVGRRYLRLDQKVEGYARLSPSILREFLTYTVVGLVSEPAALETRTNDLAAHIAAISAGKLRLVERIVGEIGARLSRETVDRGEERYCALVAGDIVYGMGHDAGRPEHSTGRMVRGSDLDLVFITRDDAPGQLVNELDDAVYQEKHRRLNNPAFREEIDYTIKPLARVREQVAFDTFKHMVPCKILHEAILVYGSRVLCAAAKALLAERGIPERLAALELAAAETRERAEKHLLDRDERSLDGEDLYLFRTSEETEEFD
jgi:hypothetical protein